MVEGHCNMRNCIKGCSIRKSHSFRDSHCLKFLEILPKISDGEDHHRVMDAGTESILGPAEYQEQCSAGRAHIWKDAHVFICKSSSFLKCSDDL